MCVCVCVCDGDPAFLSEGKDRKEKDGDDLVSHS